MTDYDDILDEIVRRGQTFEIEVDYDRCQVGGAGLNSIFGGIAWQTYIDTTPGTENYTKLNSTSRVLKQIFQYFRIRVLLR